MKNKFADYETSKILKELGFSEKCFGFYANEGKVHNICDNGWHGNKINRKETPIVSPLFQQVKHWLFVEKNIYFESKFNTKIQAFIVSAWQDGIKISEIESNIPTLAETDCIKSVVMEFSSQTAVGCYAK